MIVSVDARRPSPTSPAREARGYQLVDTRTGVIGEPTFSFIMLNTAVAPTNDLRIRQALAKGLDQAERPEDLRRPAGQAGHRHLPARLAVLQRHRLPDLRPGRGQASLVTSLQGPARHPVDHPQTITDPRPQGGPGRPADVGAGRVRRQPDRGPAGHPHRRLRAGQVPGRHLVPVRGRQPGSQLRVVEHHHRLAARQIGLNFARIERPADRDGLLSRAAHHRTVHPGHGLPDASTSGWPRTCPTCGSSSTSSRRWPRSGSRTSPA